MFNCTASSIGESVLLVEEEKPSWSLAPLHSLCCGRELLSAQSRGSCSAVGSGEVGAPRWEPLCGVCTVHVAFVREHT